MEHLLVAMLALASLSVVILREGGGSTSLPAAVWRCEKKLVDGPPARTMTRIA